MERAAKKTGFTITIVVTIIIVLFIVIFVIDWLPDRKVMPANDIREFIEVAHVEQVDSLTLTRAINLAGSYLSDIMLDNGQFVYRINLDTTVTVKPGYNILRHAGAIYALCMYHDLTGDTLAFETAQKAGKFLTKATIKPVGGKQDLLGVWSLPGILRDKSPPELKLGGTDLGLVALCSLKKLDPGVVSLDTLKKMGNFILYMQKRDGSFYSKFYPYKNGRDDSWTSLYYPGEASLGLLMLYELDPQKKWLEAASKGIDYLDRIRRGREAIEADHWALMASELLLRNFDMKENSEEKEKIINHAMIVCRSMIHAKADFSKISDFHGCLTPDGRTTPTSTRLEGLLSALTYIPLNDTAAIEFILATINDGTEFLLHAQLKDGPHAGAITRGFIPASELASGVFIYGDKRVPEIRIDYIQHALSAWIQYYNLFYAASSRPSLPSQK
ncbi:MAG: hypothetical protein ISR57_09805 [Bacteroidales bacterium]|nr:hypothetical protein [Bacteroidota bacterium]MBL6950925.1 hypothetical protein [Bacteroidales bacterium]